MSEQGRDDREEARLRAAFEAQREHDAAAAPPFARTWAAAEAQQRSRARAWGPWVPVTALASVALLVAGSGLVLWASSNGGSGTNGGSGRALAAEVASMRAEPLAFLAASPTPGALGGGGWFGSQWRRTHEEQTSW